MLLKGQVKDLFEDAPSPVQAEIDALFDKRGGIDAILYALAQRCKAESGIARGEEDDRRARYWAHLANDLEAMEVIIPD